jgi:hypothetical protein
MESNTLQAGAEAVIRRAPRPGYVVPREVREELGRAAVPQDLWKDVVALARPALSLRHGRYYYSAPVSERVRAEQSQQAAIGRAVRQLIRKHHTAADRVERREQDRIDFVHPVQVVTEDGRTFTLLSRDLSATGIRLVGTRRLLGQKVRVLVPGPAGAGTWDFVVRILWTCPVGDDLVENGGTFLAVENR